MFLFLFCFFIVVVVVIVIVIRDGNARPFICTSVSNTDTEGSLGFALTSDLCVKLGSEVRDQMLNS